MNATLRLGKAIFQRFLETDLMPPGVAQVQLMTGALTLLAAPGLLLPARFAVNYMQLAVAPDALARALIAHRLLFVTFTIIALGLVALVIWEGVFPDRRDARILGPLPIPGRVLIVARLGALAAVAAVFALGTNLVPTLIYGPALAVAGAAATPLHGVAAHLIATVSAGAFVFFGLIALQGILLNVCGRRAAERLSVALQMLFVVGLLQLAFFYPHVKTLITTRIADLAGDPLLRLIPSVWFLGLYDVLGGLPQPGAWQLAGTAVAATATAIVGAVALIASTHARLTRLALESRDAGGRSHPSIRRLAARLTASVLRAPVERALFAFTVKTLFRSRTHRMLLALYVGIALALSVSGLIPLVLRQGIAGLARPGMMVLSAPLMVLFIALGGLRAIFALPVEPKAGWVFRLLEPAERKVAVDGVRDAMLAVIVVPVAGFAWLTGSVLWGAWPAVVHGVTCFALGWILVEVLLLTLSKLPFTCTYYPGLSRMRTMWPVYLTAFTTFCYSVPSLELVMMEAAGAVYWFLCVSALLVLLLNIARGTRLRDLPGFRFQEEDPAAMFQGFQLSEGLAAQGVRPGAPRVG